MTRSLVRYCEAKVNTNTKQKYDTRYSNGPFLLKLAYGKSFELVFLTTFLKVDCILLGGLTQASNHSYLLLLHSERSINWINVRLVLSGLIQDV